MLICCLLRRGGEHAEVQARCRVRIPRSSSIESSAIGGLKARRVVKTGATVGLLRVTDTDRLLRG